MNKTILIGHGSGGMMTGNLIRDLFLKHFKNKTLEVLADSAVTRMDNDLVAFTTDSFVIDPIFFPGGNIGKLAVCGTVNDLAVSGAQPQFLSCAFILEEGFPLEDLEIIVTSMSAEAAKAGVQIITGDTKVVKKGQCDKIFINTSGIGLVNPKHADISRGTSIRPGDQVLVNGFLGDHEIAVLAARENLSFEQPLESDAASLNKMIELLLKEGIDIHFMRDVTRGGLATVLSETAVMVNQGIEIDETALPVREQVSGACEIYGFNPLYLANEGKVLMIVGAGSAQRAVELMRQNENGRDAGIIGSVTNQHAGRVIMKSVIGSSRIIDKLAGEQLPRIC